MDQNGLSSDVVSMTFTYFVNPPYPSLKYLIQFFPIDTPQNRLQGFKKLVFVSHLSSFEFFLHCRKQVEVTELDYPNRVDVPCGACNVLRINLLNRDLSGRQKCRAESHVSFAAAAFLEERSLIRVE
jgi:hypothetical protein